AATRRPDAPRPLHDALPILLHERSVAGRAAWVRLYDETMAALRFPLDGKELTISEVLHRLSDHRMEVRRDAARCLGKVLGENIRDRKSTRLNSSHVKISYAV